MKIYDFMIIGAGSAGCNIAFRLQQLGKEVVVLDKDSIAAGASGAAGAFLSPLPGKKNPYNTFVNKSLRFSLNFYKNLIPNNILKNGVLRVSNDNFGQDKLQNNEIKYKYYDKKALQNISENFKNIDGYFYEEAAIIEPKHTCEKLLESCDFFIKDVKKIKYIKKLYIIDNIKAKNIILAQGVLEHLIPLPYINISPIFGLKIDVKTSTKIPFNLHKSISVSTNKHNDTVSIGATSQRHDMDNMKCETTCDKCEFYINTDEAQISTLLSLADELITLQNLKVVKVYKGARASIKSYFPVIGATINYEASLKKYPSIKKGTIIPSNLLEYYPNMYIINALGSRGFVLAPYLAKILSDHILYDKDIPKELSCEKLFYKMARKST